MLKNDGFSQLFVDDYVIEKKTNVKRVTNPPEKYSEPVIKPDKKWEGRRAYMFGTVKYMPLEDLFKAWYVTNYWIYDFPDFIPKESFWGVTMYAESKDGINWEKPSLGLIDFGGSKENNIIRFSRFKRFTESVIYRPDIDDPAKRYQMMTCKINGGYYSYSHDGIHWGPLNEGEPIFASGDVLSVNWDPIKKQYMAGYKVSNEGPRRQGLAISKDFENWEDLGLVFEADENDPEDMQMYGFTPFRYQGMYLGLLWRYRTDPSLETMDTELVYSRDGISWNRDPSRQAFIAPGGPGKWDSHMIMGVSSDIVEYKDDIRIYYSGWNEKHFSFRETENRKNSVGFAALKKDRWVSIKAEDSGEIITKPYSAKGRLFINGKTEMDGFIKAEILNINNIPIENCCENNCIPFNGDSLSHEFAWENGSEPEKGTLLPCDKPFRIRFIMHKAELYAFRFE